jgi:hypothetical protein
MITYRKIEQTDEEWARLREFMKGVKGFIPPTHLGVAAVAEEEGEIVGAVILQMVPYLGPLKISEEYEREVSYTELRKQIDSMFDGKGDALIMQGYFAVTDDPRVARIAEFAGLEKLNCITL